MAKINLIYIAGAGRSGSTILGQILGQIKGFCSLGEVRLLWERGIIANELCGCGKPFQDCSFWQLVMDRVFKNKNESVESVLERTNDLGLRKTLPLFGRVIGTKTYKQQRTIHIKFLQELYYSISLQSDSRWLIDSSKTSYYASLLSEIVDVNLHLVHLIRDPRGYVFSMNKKKLAENTKNRYMSRLSSTNSTKQWLYNNLAILPLRKKVTTYILVRYEDFIVCPQEQLRRILKNIDYKNDYYLKNFDGKYIWLEPTHMVAGNPCRLAEGKIELRCDDEWKTKMKRFDYLYTTVITAPLLLRYRYRLNALTGQHG